MGIEANGKLHTIFETKQVSERFSKREFVVELADNHARHVWLQQEGAYHLGLAVGRWLRTGPTKTRSRPS